MRFLSRSAVKEAIRDSVISIYNAQFSELDLYRNTLDCFSASIDAVVQGISLDDWMRQEGERQIQKTKQNAIGSLHEEILGAIDGVERVPVGGLVDIISVKHKVVAEVKNKFNTTKGNHKVNIYYDLVEAINRNPGFTGYYVEILPRGQRDYNEPFHPSDNRLGGNVAMRDDVRIVDGRTFYEILTGSADALDEVYRELPFLVSDIVKEEFGESLDPHSVRESKAFYHNYDKAYGESRG